MPQSPRTLGPDNIFSFSVMNGRPLLNISRSVKTLMCIKELYTDLHCRKAVTAHFTSKQLLPFGFAERCTHVVTRGHKYPCKQKTLAECCANAVRRWHSILSTSCVQTLQVKGGPWGSCMACVCTSLNH